MRTWRNAPTFRIRAPTLAVTWRFGDAAWTHHAVGAKTHSACGMYMLRSREPTSASDPPAMNEQAERRFGASADGSSVASVCLTSEVRQSKQDTCGKHLCSLKQAIDANAVQGRNDECKLPRQYERPGLTPYRGKRARARSRRLWRVRMDPSARTAAPLDRVQAAAKPRRLRGRAARSLPTSANPPLAAHDAGQAHWAAPSADSCCRRLRPPLPRQAGPAGGSARRMVGRLAESPRRCPCERPQSS